VSAGRTSPAPPSWWWLAAIVAVAVAVRVAGLGAWDVWTDELHTMEIARSGAYSFGPAYKTAPLNFILTGWAMRALGDNILAARTVPFVAGLLTVPLLVFLGARWVGRRAALLAGLVVALSAWHVYWSQTARHFALATLFVLVALHCFLAYWKDRRWWGAILAPAALLLALFTHSSAGFYLAAMMTFVGGSLLWRLARPESDTPTPRHHLLTLSALGLALAIYLPAYLSVGRYLLSNIAPWNPAWNILGSLAFYIPPAVAFVALAGVAFLVAEHDALAMLLLACLIVPAVLLSVASKFTTASAAYNLPSLLVVALLVGVAGDRLLARAGGRAVRWALALVVAGAFANETIELALYHTYYRGLRPRWSDAANYLREHRRPGELILASEADVVAYYLGSRDDIGWIDLRTADLREATVKRQPGGGVWYAVYSTAGSPLELTETARRHLEEQTQLKRVFQMNYGPKDRSIALYYEAPAATP
jgi:mannosyltransferase